MLTYHVDLKKVQKRQSKLEKEASELRAKEKELLGETIFRCDNVLEKGTLFERECGAEFPIKELTYIQPMHYNSAAYEEGWERDNHSGELQCPFCKTIWSFRTDYNYTTRKYEEENPYIALKYHFKDVVEQHR